MPRPLLPQRRPTRRPHCPTGGRRVVDVTTPSAPSIVLAPAADRPARSSTSPATRTHHAEFTTNEMRESTARPWSRNQSVRSPPNCFEWSTPPPRRRSLRGRCRRVAERRVRAAGTSRPSAAGRYRRDGVVHDRPGRRSSALGRRRSPRSATADGSDQRFLDSAGRRGRTVAALGAGLRAAAARRRVGRRRTRGSGTSAGAAGGRGRAPLAACRRGRLRDRSRVVRRKCSSLIGPCRMVDRPRSGSGPRIALRTPHITASWSDMRSLKHVSSVARVSAIGVSIFSHTSSGASGVGAGRRIQARPRVTVVSGGSGSAPTPPARRGTAAAILRRAAPR